MIIIINYFLSVQECSVDMNFNSLLIKLKVIGKFAKQSFFINFYDLEVMPKMKILLNHWEQPKLKLNLQMGKLEILSNPFKLIKADE